MGEYRAKKKSNVHLHERDTETPFVYFEKVDEKNLTSIAKNYIFYINC